MDMDQILNRIFDFAGTRRKNRSSLKAMAAALQLLDNPHHQLRAIHVTGTSGKTSTCYYLQALLEASGQRTGLTVSPHIHTLGERVQIGGVPLGDENLCNTADQMLTILEPMRGELTYFELMICLALWTFAREKVDYAIVEVGIGGTRDATNVLPHTNKVAVIGPIGLDHTEKLGTTIPEIADQKAGIIPCGSVVFVADQSHEALDVIQERAYTQGAQVSIVDPTSVLSGEIPGFQNDNWVMAHTVVEYVANRDGFALPSDSVLAELHHVRPPARFEWITTSDHRILLDGAHSPQKVAGLVEALRAQGEQPFPTLATVSRAPEAKVKDTLQALAPMVSHLIIPEFVLGRDSKTKVSVPSAQVAEVADSLGISHEVIPDLAQAVRTLLSNPQEKLLVTGSLYLAALVRPML
jgi:dihydrofolate synthase/folylpolyglutamate synthase